MDLATRSLINSAGLLIFGSGLTFIMARFWYLKNLALSLAKETEAKAKAISDEHARVMVRLAEMEGKLALVNQAIIPISTAFQAILIKELTHFHTPEMDALMTKIGPPNTLTVEEQHRLSVLLVERTEDMGPEISDSERDAALILPMVIKRAVAEQAQLAEAEALKMRLVSVAAVVGVPHVIHDADSEPTHEVLKKIEEHTEATALALASLNRRATDKLVQATRDKGDTEKTERRE